MVRLGRVFQVHMIGGNPPASVNPVLLCKASLSLVFSCFHGQAFDFNLADVRQVYLERLLSKAVKLRLVETAKNFQYNSIERYFKSIPLIGKHFTLGRNY